MDKQIIIRIIAFLASVTCNALNESAASSLEINGRSGKTLLFYIMDAQGAGGLYRGGKLAFYFPAVKNSA